VIDFNALSAWAAVIAVLVAIAALALQVRQAAFNSSLDSLWHLEDRFNAMISERSAAANYLRAHAASPDKRWDPMPLAGLEAVLNFFSLLGYLVAAGAVREEAAWMKYSTWVFAYWPESREYVKSRRNQNPLYWRHYDRLVARMARIEATKRLELDNRFKWGPGFAYVASWFDHARSDSRWMDEAEKTLAEEGGLATVAEAAGIPKTINPN
jgi:hypothetical protein